MTNKTLELVGSNCQPIKILNLIYLSINLEAYDSMADLMNALYKVGMLGSAGKKIPRNIKITSPSHEFFKFCCGAIVNLIIFILKSRQFNLVSIHT